MTATAQAHNGEPAPVPPMPVDVSTERVLPPRWSWLHWWEANREPYLISVAQDPPDQLPDEAQLRALRVEAARELMQAMQQTRNESLIAESALALGKMRHEEGLPLLTTLVQKSGTSRLRMAGFSAIGMIGSPAAENELVQLEPVRLEDRVAALAAVGFLPEIEAETLAGLRRSVSEGEPAIATVVCWSLRQHHQEDNLDYYGQLLRTSESPWVASEALLSLGRTGDRRAIPLLEDVLRGYPRAGAGLLAWRTLQSLHELKEQRLKQGLARDAEYRRLVEWQQKMNPNQPPVERKAIRMHVVLGEEQIRLAWLRASAAIALGQIDDPQAGEALLRFVETPAAEDEYLVMPKGIAIMALAAHPSERSRDRLIGLLGKRDHTRRMHIDAPIDSPLRGFAALALGLYARPHETEQGPADRAGFDWAIMTLAERLEDQNEDLETRVACALALGLTQRTEVLPVLHRAFEKVPPRNMVQHPLLGYLLLARAMVGDGQVIEPVEQFLSTRDDTSMSGIVGRRAAVLALGVRRTPVVIPPLTRAWHLNHYVNREVVVALRLVGASNAATPILQAMRESKNEEERAYFAQVLGELLAAEQPTPLARLTVQSNYTVRNDHLLPLQRIANGFLFDYLIASFGDRW